MANILCVSPGASPFRYAFLLNDGRNGEWFLSCVPTWIISVAAEKDSRALAGSVRKVLKLINKVYFAYKRGEWNNGRQKDEQALESKQASRVLEDWPRHLVQRHLLSAAPTMFSASQNVCISGMFVNHIKLFLKPLPVFSWHD